ncbi:MAG: hypothetical protein H6779_04440 [Candidatus Nomurabacteria bacterium]|nr:MAG: hypothetical protein H6779_04440 [Candidatus Nomurabacteria bacterium]
MKIIGGILSLVVFFPISVSADTFISNSVSVSASNGVSTTHVRTISNGEVVEDTTISSTTPYQYKSSYSSEDGLSHTKVDTSINDKLTELNRLLDLLAKLQTLMSYYEKLQTKQ